MGGLDYRYLFECLNRALHILQTDPRRIQDRLTSARESAFDGFPVTPQEIPDHLQQTFIDLVEDLKRTPSDDEARRLVERILDLKRDLQKHVDRRELGQHCCTHAIDGAIADHQKTLDAMCTVRAENLRMSPEDFDEYEAALKRLSDRAQGWCEYPGHNVAKQGA